MRTAWLSLIWISSTALMWISSMQFYFITIWWVWTYCVCIYIQQITIETIKWSFLVLCWTLLTLTVWYCMCHKESHMVIISGRDRKHQVTIHETTSAARYCGIPPSQTVRGSDTYWQGEYTTDWGAILIWYFYYNIIILSQVNADSKPNVKGERYPLITADVTDIGEKCSGWLLVWDIQLHVMQRILVASFHIAVLNPSAHSSRNMLETDKMNIQLPDIRICVSRYIMKEQYWLLSEKYHTNILLIICFKF